jgi:hypothetical protein
VTSSCKITGSLLVGFSRSVETALVGMESGGFGMVIGLEGMSIQVAQEYWGVT